MANFVRNVIQMLKTDQYISLTDMLRNRIALAKCIRQALDNAHEKAMLETYQQQLELACCDTENVQTFRFDPNIYEARRTYDPSTGRVFEKHYLEFPPKCCYYTFERIFIGSSLGGLMPRSL